MNRVTQRTYEVEPELDPASASASGGPAHGSLGLPVSAVSAAAARASIQQPILQALQELRDVRERVRLVDRPFVTLAYAQSLDGSITTRRGRRYALSGPESLRLTHALRADHDAILVGVGTVLADDPELRVRLVDGPSPRPVIVDSRLRTPPDAKLLAQLGRSPLIGTTERADREHPHRRSGILARGSRILTSPALPNGWVDLAALLRALSAEGIRHVMVEGGARIITSFLGAGLVDYAVITVAPIFLGGLSAVERLGRGEAGGPGHPAGDHRSGFTPPRLARVTMSRLGDDLIIAGQLAVEAVGQMVEPRPAPVVTPLVPDAGWPRE